MQIKTVLYVTTQITGTCRYFSWCAYPNIWYARLQKRVIDQLKLNPNIDLFVKFYPNDYLKNPNINYAKQNDVCILNDSLVYILANKRFDLIVLEAPATTLLETLCTQSQILLLANKDFMKIDAKALEILSKRVFVANSEECCFDLVNYLLTLENSSQFKKIDDTFLLTYGIGSLNQDPKFLVSTYLKKIL